MLKIELLEQKAQPVLAVRTTTSLPEFSNGWGRTVMNRPGSIMSIITIHRRRFPKRSF